MNSINSMKTLQMRVYSNSLQEVSSRNLFKKLLQKIYPTTNTLKIQRTLKNSNLRTVNYVNNQKEGRYLYFK